MEDARQHTRKRANGGGRYLGQWEAEDEARPPILGPLISTNHVALQSRPRQSDSYGESVFCCSLRPSGSAYGTDYCVKNPSFSRFHRLVSGPYYSPCVEDEFGGKMGSGDGGGRVWGALVSARVRPMAMALPPPVTTFTLSAGCFRLNNGTYKADGP